MNKLLVMFLAVAVFTLVFVSEAAFAEVVIETIPHLDVYKNFDSDYTFLVKNIGSSRTLYFEINDTSGFLSTFDYVSLNISSVFMNEAQILPVSLLFDIPGRVLSGNYELNLLVKDGSSLIANMPISLSVSDKSHWLEIVSVDFDKENYSPGEYAVAKLLVNNNGLLNEDVKVRKSIGFGFASESAVPFFIPAKNSMIIESGFVVPESEDSKRIDVNFEVFNDYNVESKSYSSSNLSSYLNIVVPKYMFSTRFESRTPIIGFVGEFFEKTLLVSNIGNTPDVYSVSVNYNSATLETAIIPVAIGNMSRLKMGIPLIQNFSNSSLQLVARVCSLSSEECKTDSITIKTLAKEESNAVKEEKISPEISASVILGSMSAEPSSPAIFTLKLYNPTGSSQSIIVDAGEYSGELVVKVLPESPINLEPGREEEVYIYVLTNPESGGLYNVFISAKAGEKIIIDRDVALNVEKRGVSITGLSVAVSKPLTYLVPFVLLILGVSLLYFRKMKNGGGKDPYEKAYS